MLAVCSEAADPVLPGADRVELLLTGKASSGLLACSRNTVRVATVVVADQWE
jgi:hypothetical protein